MSLRADIKTRTAHAYVICGWHTRSDIPIATLPKRVPSNESIEVTIQIATGSSPLKNSERHIFEHSAEYSLVGIPGVADFEVSRGQQIRVWPAAGATQKNMEIFLLGPVWAALCHQRELLPLHASAIETRGGITAFAGHCGTGKSTTAACMTSLGYKLVADDILPVSFNQNSQPGAWPYLRRLKLQNDSITRLALVPMEPVSELDKEKYFVHPKYAAEDKWNRMERVYLLEIDPTASSTRIDRITGSEAVRALIDQTYHFDFIRGSGRFGNHLAFCTQLASKIAVYRLRRSPTFGLEKRLGLLLREHLEDAPD